MTASTMARPMPGMAPSTATPTKQTMESQNSQRWMRQMRRRSATSISPMAAAMTTAASAVEGKCFSSSGAKVSNRATATAPTTPVSWVLAPAASATGVRELLLLIGKPWNRPAVEVGHAQPDHFLIGIDVVAGAHAVGPRQHAGVGERYQRHRAAAQHDCRDVRSVDPGNGEARQSLGQGAENGNAGFGRQIERAHDDGGRDHRDQHAGDALAAEEKNDDQRRRADGKGRPVGLARRHRLADFPQAAQRPIGIDREAQQLRELADDHREAMPFM